MLSTLARVGVRRRWVVLVIWVAALCGFVAAASAVGDEFSNSFDVPGAESQEAFDLLEQRFPAFAGDTAVVPLHTRTSVFDPQVRSEAEALFAAIAQLDHVALVASPYDDPTGARVSTDRTIAYATVHFDGRAQDLPHSIVDELNRLARSASNENLQVELGGRVVEFAEREGPGEREQIGVLVALVVLLVTFGTVAAAGVPLVTALFGVGVGLMLVTLTSQFLTISRFAPQLATMIALGVGIDYALLIVTRYRQAFDRHHDVELAVMEAMRTAGRSVLFAGITVVIALLGLVLVGVTIVTGMAIASALAVLMTMVAALSLLPALLGFGGRHLDRMRLPLLRRQHDHTASRWFRWSRRVQRHPVGWAVLGVLALVVLTIPVFSMRLGTADAGNLPESRTTRRAYDLLAEGFGPGFNGPLLVVGEAAAKGDLYVLDDLRFTVGQLESVAAVSPLTFNGDGTAAVFEVVPKFSPQEIETEALLKTLRDDLVPQATAGSDATVLVGGITATFADLADLLAARLPILIVAVLLVSFLLLTAVFRSVVVSVKAGIMNLLSVTASYGVIVAVFQWGWGLELIGLDRTGPIEPFVPLFLFAILFGLSMDYEVFLLSRIREEFDRTGDNSEAVADGLAATARVITAAAAIMITLFASFAFGDERLMKLFGIGLASAILIDVTIVRTLLVPATMELLGRLNWWMPAWLARVLPELSLEGMEAVEPAVSPPASPAVEPSSDQPLAPTGAPASTLIVEGDLRPAGPDVEGSPQSNGADRSAATPPAGDDPNGPLVDSATPSSAVQDQLLVAVASHAERLSDLFGRLPRAENLLEEARYDTQLLSHRLTELGLAILPSAAHLSLRAMRTEASELSERVARLGPLTMGNDVVTASVLDRWGLRSRTLWQQLEDTDLLFLTPPPSPALMATLSRIQRHEADRAAQPETIGVDDLDLAELFASRLDELGGDEMSTLDDTDVTSEAELGIPDEVMAELLDRPVERELVELYLAARNAR